MRAMFTIFPNLSSCIIVRLKRYKNTDKVDLRLEDAQCESICKSLPKPSFQLRFEVTSDRKFLRNCAKTFGIGIENVHEFNEKHSIGTFLVKAAQ
ncbi:hypothetical protein L596_023500 [Steinernema carpocapsae]|uniref:Uncharacterized protein n=1 Tax=Steinernema carpocapsae TaxID=34508 RepID=A0A4U5MDU4_STECR|nr:hypothetical protein L596_023500 [Steinernema carpocapsae]